MGGMIQGSGKGMGVDVSTSGIVTLNGGVKVMGFATGLKVTKGTLTMTKGSITGKNNGVGVYAMGGTVRLDGVTVSKVERGVEMVGTGNLTVSGGEIKEFTKYGVMVGDGVTSASLMGTVITGGGKGKGIHARGKKVTLSGVEISKVEEGVVMMGKGEMTVSGGEIKEFTKYGVYVGIDVTSASLTGTKIVGQNKGVGVYATGGTVRLEGVTVSRVMTGVKVEGKGSLTVGKGSVDFKGAHGVYVGSEVKSASLTGTTITGDGKGKGIHARGER